MNFSDYNSKLTLSYFCSFPRLAMPPQKSEVPRTNSRFDSMEPKSEYFTTSTLCCPSAKIAIISSVALPHVAFSSPPTTKTKIYKKELNSRLLKFPSIILKFQYKHV